MAIRIHKLLVHELPTSRPPYHTGGFFANKFPLTPEEKSFINALYNLLPDKKKTKPDAPVVSGEREG